MSGYEDDRTSAGEDQETGVDQPTTVEEDPVCAICGEPIGVDDIVCPHCGNSLVAG